MKKFTMYNSYDDLEHDGVCSSDVCLSEEWASTEPNPGWKVLEFDIRDELLSFYKNDSVCAYARELTDETWEKAMWALTVSGQNEDATNEYLMAVLEGLYDERHVLVNRRKKLDESMNKISNYIKNIELQLNKRDVLRKEGT